MQDRDDDSDVAVRAGRRPGKTAATHDVPLAVIRKGRRVFLGTPGREGIWIECVSAYASRSTAAKLQSYLRNGFDGELIELVLRVGHEVTAETDLHRARMKAHSPN